MTKFREHRGGLAESLETTVEVADFAALVVHIHALLYPWWIDVTPDMVNVTSYGYDSRTGWHDYIVTVKDYGVVGFTDGPL